MSHVHVIKEFSYPVTGQRFRLNQVFDDTEVSAGYVISMEKKAGDTEILASFNSGRYPDASDHFKAVVTPML